MADTTKTIRRSIATLQLPKSVPALIVYAKGTLITALRTPRLQQALLRIPL